MQEIRRRDIDFFITSPEPLVCSRVHWMSVLFISTYGTQSRAIAKNESAEVY